jgi:hypothetical protein
VEEKLSERQLLINLTWRLYDRFLSDFRKRAALFCRFPSWSNVEDVRHTERSLPTLGIAMAMHIVAASPIGAPHV